MVLFYLSRGVVFNLLFFLNYAYKQQKNIMSTQKRDPVEMQKEIQRLQAELERMKMEEEIQNLQAQLEETQGGGGVVQDDEEDYTEEIIEEEVVEEEVIEEQDGPVGFLAKNSAGAAAAAPTSNAAPPAALPFKARVIPQIPASSSGQETPLELILGPQLYSGGKLIKRSTLACTQDQDLVLLYFAAQWQRECKQFFPCLKDFYCTINSPGNPRRINMECVYVSSDRSLQAFKEYFAKMPWPAMPTGTSDLKNDISQKLKIIDMPSLVVLDVATGHVYTTHAAAQVLDLERNNVDQANALVESWQQIPPISMEQVQQDLRLKHGIMARDVLYWA